MTARPAFPGVAIVGVYNTKQALRLPGETSRSLAMESVFGALDDAGLSIDEVDGISGGQGTSDLVYELRIGPVWIGGAQIGIQIVAQAASAIAAGQADVVVITAGGAGDYADRSATAPWTRPTNEFVASYGLFTAAEFALVARRHMHMYGTTPEQLARVAATIRNNGHVNEDAVYFGRGPFTVDDILASRMVADPYHLLDCAMTAEGGCALVLATAERAADLRKPPVYLLGAGHDLLGPSYTNPPSWDLAGRRDPSLVNGVVGRRASARAFAAAGIAPTDVDVLELYDPFSFEIIRQLEAYGFCGPGEGGPFVEEGNIDPGGPYPVSTDGGLLSYSHAGIHPQMLQRVIRGVQQLRGECRTNQVDGAEVALCTNGGAGALFTSVMVLGSQPA
jgi:acetyl-CoA acetyltransferase